MNQPSGFTPDYPALNLQKGAGIRRPNLHAFLGSRLRANWRIVDDEAPERVRAIVLLRLKAVLDAIREPNLDLVVWTAYNVGVPSPVNTEGVTQRMESLAEAKLSPRTCRRRLEEFQKELLASLKRPHPELAERDLQQAMHWLEQNVRPGARLDASTDVAELIRTIRAPAEGAMRAFLDSRTFGPALADGSLLPAMLGPQGDWLCVFTRPVLLGEYVAATKARWPRVVGLTGLDVVRSAHGRSTPTGVLVNPSARRGSGVDATLPLPPHVVAELAASR